MRIGIIGLGTIATALVEGIADDGHDIAVSTRSRKNSSRLAERFGNVTVAENQGVIDASEVVFVGTTGDAAPGVLGPLVFRPNQQVVSLMADMRLQAVADLVAPATLSARMIPFPTIATGGSPILTFGDRDPIDALLGARNRVFALDSESELDAYLCAQAVLSPAVGLVGDAAGWLGDRVADRDKAETFLRTLVGASLLGSSCGALLQALNTPGGYNQRLKQHMDAAGVGKRLRAGLDLLNKPEPPR